MMNAGEDGQANKLFGRLAQALDIFFVIVFLALCSQIFTYMYEWFEKNTTVYSLKKDAFIHIDFINSYMMGKMALSDQAHRMYDPQAQLEWYNKVIYPAKVTSPCFNQYPPFYPVLFSAFTFLPMREAFLLWNFLSMSLGSVALFLAIKVRKVLPPFSAALLILGVLFCFPSSDSAMNGEMTWFFLAIFSFFYVALSLKRDIAGGIASGLMTLKPHFFLILFIASIFSARKNLLISGGVVIFTILAVSGIMIGWENVFGYPNVLLHAESTNVTTNLFPERMVCLRGPASLFLSRAEALKVGFCGFVFGLGLTTYFWFRSLRQKKMSIEWAMALSLVCLSITSPHMHVYDSVLLGLSAAVTLPSVMPTVVLRLKPVSFKIWCLLFVFYPVLSWVIMAAVPPIGRSFLPASIQEFTGVNGGGCLLLSFYVYLVYHALLLACGMVYAFKHDQEEHSSSSA